MPSEESTRDEPIRVLLAEDDAARNREMTAAVNANAATAIENARLLRESRTRQAHLESLMQLTGELARLQPVELLLGRIAEACGRLLGTDSAGFRLVDGDELVVVGTIGDANQIMSTARLRIGKSLSGIVAATGEPLLVRDPANDPRVIPAHRAALRSAGHRAFLGIPVKAGARLVGVLSIRTRRSEGFSAEDVAIATSFAAQAAIALENARLYDESERARSELQVTNAELDSFAYSVSHDLKSPLVTIQGMAGILLEDHGQQLPGEAVRYLERIQANVQKMEHLILDLLALSRIGRESRTPEALSLAQVLDDVSVELATSMRDRRIQLVRGELTTIWGIRTRIEQVMCNLLGNAVKYLGDTSDPRIEVGALDRGAMVECYVKDNGIGIDPAYHERIFEIFHRLGEIEAEGTGVGLAIVKKIIQMGGGRVWVESAKGQGATFRFTWPKGPGETPP